MKYWLFAAAISFQLFATRHSFAQIEEGEGTTPSGTLERGRTLTRAPVLLHDSPPQYPADVATIIETTVTLVLTIDERGAVRDAAVASPPQAGFDDAALRAARELRFTPAEVDGKAAPVRLNFRYQFIPPAPIAPEEELALEKSGPPKSEKDRHPTEYPQAEIPEEEVVIQGRTGSLLGAASLLPSEGAKVAGSVGDALNAVQSLPGVSATPSGSGEISIWGATPEESRVYIDDVPVPALYHRGGYRSIIHEALVSHVQMTPAAFGPGHGRALGGLVEIETKRVEGIETHGEFGADFIGAQAAVHTEPTPVFGAMAAGRFGYLDHILPAVAPDIEQVVPLSAYRDYAGKIRLGEDPNRYSEISVFGAFDAVERSQPTSDPDSPSSENTRESFHRIAARHIRHSASHEDKLGVWLGLDLSDMQAQFSDVGTNLETQSYRYGARASRNLFVTRSLTLTLGAEFEGEHTESEREGTLGLPAREGDIVAFGQSPASQVGSDEWNTDMIGVATYAEAEIRSPAGMFVVSPSLRVEPIVQIGDRIVPAGNAPAIGYSRLDLAVSPRLAVSTEPVDGLNIQLAGSLVHQPSPSQDRSPVFGGPELGLSHAGHGLLGLVYRIQRATTLEVTAFAKHGWDLVMRNPVEPPAVANALVNTGASRNYGGQFLLRGKPHEAVSGWITYTLSKAERRQSAAEPWRPSDYDQRHLFTAVVSVQLSPSWNVGARARGASGLPRTQVTGAYYDARLDAYQPLFGAHNQQPLPFSFQLDLHAEWSKRWAANALTLYLDLINATNQENAVERTYNFDYSESGVLRSLPILAVMGGKVEF